MSVIDNSQKKCNIAYFYGDDNIDLVDVLQNMEKKFRKLFTDKEILLCTGEQFINDLIESLRQGKSEEFRAKYRNSDILLIDEIQSFKGKQSCLEELYHTLKHLYINGKQIVVTSDVKPNEMPCMDERVLNLLSKGQGFELKYDANGKRIIYHEQDEISEDEILQMFKNTDI